MTNFEAKEYRRGLIDTALLRTHVRKFLDATMKYNESELEPWLAEWREEAVKLFDAKHWWDIESRNLLDNLKKERAA